VVLYLGTKDDSETQRQLGSAMGIVNSPHLLKMAYQRVIETYQDQKLFLYGNHIWVGEEFTLKPDYKELVLKQFGSEASNIDFTSFDAVYQVNQWISNKTNKKIENLVESFSKDSKMFLANALYFNEKWLEPFEERDHEGNIIEETFDTGSMKVTVPMIQHISSEIVYGEITTKGNNFLEVVTIPYKNKNFEMQLVIPKIAKGLDILEDEMILKDRQDDQTSFNIFKTLKNESFDINEDVRLRMPRFKVKSKFDAAEALKGLGAEEVFTAGAELDKIADGGQLGVGKIIHEAVVEISKEGTEDAAATGIELVLLSGSFGVQNNIVLDRPFIFIVQDRVNNIPVLVGRVKNQSDP
jgi:serpin B